MSARIGGNAMLHTTHSRFMDDFFRDAQIQLAFKHVRFNYLALKIDEDFVVVQGRVFLTNLEVSSLPTALETANVRAAHYRLSDLNLTPRELVEQLLRGKVLTPQGELLFPETAGSFHGATYT